MLQIVILAAGQGKRMASNLAKVLHPLAGIPMLLRVINTCQSLSPQRIVIVVGHGQEQVKERLTKEKFSCEIVFAEQQEQLGTGHAVQCAVPYLASEGQVLLLYGDVPLITSTTLQALSQLAVAKTAKVALALLTLKMANPYGYGRIIRNNQDKVTAIIEEKDANEQQRACNEVNTGFMAIPANLLADWLGRINNDNAQQEYYLTDLVKIAVKDKVAVRTLAAPYPWEVYGVNSKKQLAELERTWQNHQANQLLEQGVTLLDPLRLDIRGTLKCGKDVQIDVGCVFIGNVSLEDGVEIAPYCVIKDSYISAGCKIAAFSHLDSCQVGGNSIVGPYARLRPETVLAEQVHIGNFVEVKKSHIGKGSKVNHLSYIGDAEIGKKVNIGAGTITCNYDGVNKYQTIIEDDVFIGSDSQLVAPVRVGKGATLAAGTTLTHDAPEASLTLSRVRQSSVQNWRRIK